MKEQDITKAKVKTDPLQDPSPKIPQMTEDAKKRKKVYYDILSHRKSNFKNYR